MIRAHASALTALLLFAMTGCSSNHQAAAATGAAATDTATPDAAATDTATPDAAATDGAAADPATAAADPTDGASDDKTGVGHVSLSGQYSLDRDFTVSGCQVGPPGEGLLSGYHMTSEDGATPIALLSVTLKEYDKDASYAQANVSREAAAGRAMTSGVMGPLTLMVMQDATSPLAFGQVPASKLTITISDNGAKGDAEFTDLESQTSMANFDPKTGSMHAGKRVSGSVTWTCGSVGRINAHMNDAVNGAFHTLTTR
jgi:hypothetical protein